MERDYYLFPAAGQFILSGQLQTRKQAEQLSSYLSLNFPYLDLLKTQIIVEEDIINQIQAWLRESYFSEIIPEITHGEVSLNGTIPSDKMGDLNQIIEKIKQIPSVRVVNNSVHPQTTDTRTFNISDHYLVTGKSRIGSKFTIVVNGRILSEGDDLDGMVIKKITANHVYLEKGEDRFRIDY